MTITADSATPSAVIDRVSLLLDAFDGPGRLTLAQLVRRTGLPRSSVHRMLERLVQLRWLRRDGRDYELGTRLVELGSLAVHQDRLHAAALPMLYELHRATGLVVHLSILDGADVVYLEKIGAGIGVAVATRIGGRQPVVPRSWTAAPPWPVRPATPSVRRPSCGRSWTRCVGMGWPSTVRSCSRASAAWRLRSEASAMPWPLCRCAGR